MCALIAPEIVDQDEDDGRVRLLDADPQRCHEAQLDAAGYVREI